MDRLLLNHLISTNGDQHLAVADRWKSIRHMLIDNSRTIHNIQDKIKDGKVTYVDKQVTLEGKSIYVTGFYILERLTPEFDFYQKNERLTFISCEYIQSLTFNNEDANGEQLRTDINAFVTAMYP